jgi:hypothetical protein
MRLSAAVIWRRSPTMDTADEAVAIGHLYPGQIVRIESGVVRHDPVEE